MKKVRWVLYSLLPVLLLLWPVPALAQPPLPHAFYGTVEVNTIDAPVNTVVTAKVGETICGSYTTKVAGQYGSLSQHDYLIVQGDISSGDTITFDVNGFDTRQTYLFEAGGGPTELNLTVTIPPTIGYSPSSFSFAATVGGSDPPNQTLSISNSGPNPTAMDWSVADDAAWLGLSPASGTSTGEVDSVAVSVSISGMSAGSYSATITISAPEASNTPQTVPVTLTISAPPEEEERDRVAEEEVTAEDIEGMTAEDAAEAVEEMTTEEAVDIVEGVTTETAVDIIEEVTTETAVTIIEEVTTETAVDIIEEVTTGTAVDIIEEVTTGTAVDIIEEVTTETAVDIIEEVTTGTAVDIVEGVTTETAADIIEGVTTETAVDIIEGVTTETAADIIEGVTTETAVDIIEEVTTGTLNDLVGEMSEDSLMDTLPEVSTDTLHSIDLETLFDALPSAPTEQLTSEEPPVPPADLEAPIVRYVHVSETGVETKYVAIRTEAGEWVVVTATPEPLDKLMIKTKRALTDVETIVEIAEELLPGVTVGLPAGQIVRAYINITFENATPEDIELGHLAFHVENEWLEQNSIHKWSVVLNRYDPELEQWISLPTKRVGEDETYTYYTVIISRFSTFAISGSQVAPPLEFKTANLVIEPIEAETGEAITISADVTNLSDTAGTYVATLWIDSTVEAGKDVYLEAGETTTVLFTVVGDAKGSYEVRVDRLFGSFSVTEVITPPVPPPVPVPVLETDLFGSVSSFSISETGEILETIEVTSADGNLAITIPSATIALDEEGNPLGSLEAAVDESPPDPPEDAHIVGVAYDFGPEGATFDPPITLEYTYDPADIPEGVAEEDLVIAYYDEETGKWVELDCIVDTENNTITASVEHFTTFAIIGAVALPPPPPPPVPAAFSLSELSIQPASVEPQEAVTITVSVANTGGTEGSYSVVLKINGVKEAEKSITVAAGKSRDISFSVTKEDAGTYSIVVDGLSGSFTVVAPVPAKPPINWPILGGIIAGVIVVGLLIFFLVIRRRAY